MYGIIMNIFFKNILILIVELGMWMSLWNLSDVVIGYLFPSATHKIISYITIMIICILFYYLLTN